MTAFAGAAFIDPAQAAAANPLLERINALRAQEGKPPITEEQLAEVAGTVTPGAGDASFSRLAVGAQQAQAGQPSTPALIEPATSGQLRPQAVTSGQPQLPSVPQPAQGAQVPIAPTQAAPPAQAAPVADPLEPIVGQLAQFFDPGSRNPDLKKVPPVTVVSEISDRPTTDTGRLGDPFGGGFGRGPSLAINRPETSAERVALPRRTPRRTWSVKIGNQTVGVFESEEMANQVQALLRDRLRQGPAPAIPRLGLGSAIISTGSRDLDDVLFGRSPREDLELRSRLAGTLSTEQLLFGRSAREREQAREELRSGLNEDERRLGLRRQPQLPEEVRLVNTLEQLFGDQRAAGPTIPANQRAREGQRMFQRGLINEDALFALVEPRFGIRPDRAQKLQILRENPDAGLPTPEGVLEFELGVKGKKAQIAATTALTEARGLNAQANNIRARTAALAEIRRQGAADRQAQIDEARLRRIEQMIENAAAKEIRDVVKAEVTILDQGYLRSSAAVNRNIEFLEGEIRAEMARQRAAAVRETTFTIDEETGRRKGQEVRLKLQPSQEEKRLREVLSVRVKELEQMTEVWQVARNQAIARGGR